MSVCGIPALWLALAAGATVWAEQVAVVEVCVRNSEELSSTLQGQLVEGSWEETRHADSVQGGLRVVKERAEGPDQQHISEDHEPWIGVVPVLVDDGDAPTGNQESFAAAVVRKMKRALVLGASALIILALNQNTFREMDLSQVLSKPVIVIQTSENVTKLIGALLRGLHATAQITYKTILQDNLGATLTLWSSCGRSRGGLYGEWQGVICTGESNSQVQKYLQQLWNTVLLVALILSTGVMVQAHWQYQEQQGNDNAELLPKQDVLKRLRALKTRKYRPSAKAGEPDSCAVCLEQYHALQCLRVLPCLHEFHRDCVDPWLLLQHTCPLCKRSILGKES